MNLTKAWLKTIKGEMSSIAFEQGLTETALEDLKAPQGDCHRPHFDQEKADEGMKAPALTNQGIANWSRNSPPALSIAFDSDLTCAQTVWAEYAWQLVEDPTDLIGAEVSERQLAFLACVNSDDHKELIAPDEKVRRVHEVEIHPRWAKHFKDAMPQWISPGQSTSAKTSSANEVCFEQCVGSMCTCDAEAIFMMTTVSAICMIK